MGDLSGKRVLMLLGAQYEDDEGKLPLEFLRERGAEVVVAGLERGVLEGLRGRAKINVDVTIDEVGEAAAYDAMVIPGGRGPAHLRKHPEAVELVADFFATGKPLAAICHGPQMLASAGLLRGRHITSYPKIKNEMIEAGANFSDEPVVIDANLITSRSPRDIEAFTGALEDALTRQPVR
ncbi:MAG TPA: type 1 glutamine amidotransferase domain-containing protein [Candidatus Anoxymicrobiaceae bacterium]